MIYIRLPYHVLYTKTIFILFLNERIFGARSMHCQIKDNKISTLHIDAFKILFGGKKYNIENLASKTKKIL